MSAVTALLLAVAAGCACLGLAHLVMWRAIRSERVHLSIALALLGFGTMCAANAFVSVASNPFVPHWAIFVSGFTAGTVVVYGSARSAYDALHLPMTWWRRAVVWTVTVSTFLRSVILSIRVYTWPSDGTTPTWETTIFDESASTYVVWLIIAAVPAIVAVDARRATGARGGVAWAILAAGAALVALPILLLLRIGDPATPFLAYMAAGYAAFALGRLAVLAVRGVRGADPLSGVERYRKLYRLGAGGMGEAWLAVRSGERGFHRLVVIKHMRSSTDDDAGVALDRFLSEARLAARLNHSGIVSVFDIGRMAGGWYIVMEYLMGVTLAEIVRDARRSGRPVPLYVVAEAGIQLGRALAHAHEAGVVHRDVSPDNVILTFEGAFKVIDFGIAQSMGDNTAATVRGDAEQGPLTQLGSVIGKKPYMAPERLDGAAATATSDIFAVSVVLHELVTLSRPALGTILARWARKGSPIQGAGPLGEIIRRGLAEEPADRYPSGRAFARALELARPQCDPLDVEEWVRTSFAGEFARTRQLAALANPTAESVTPLVEAGSNDTTDVPAVSSSAAATVPDRPTVIR